MFILICFFNFAGDSPWFDVIIIKCSTNFLYFSKNNFSEKIDLAFSNINDFSMNVYFLYFHFISHLYFTLEQKFNVLKVGDLLNKYFYKFSVYPLFFLNLFICLVLPITMKE